MSNLRSDCRNLVKDLPAGDVYKSHIERLCYQIDEIEEYWHEANRRIIAAKALLEEAVCVKDPDMGVAMLSQEGTTHKENIDGKQVNVYDHEYFSPLGDALIAVWKALQPVKS